MATESDKIRYREHYHANKKSILKNAKKRVATCECGQEGIQSCNMWNHRKTKQHQLFLLMKEISDLKKKQKKKP